MEMEHHHVEAHDTFGKMVGLQTALLAMLLSVFTILSHQSNMETILLGNETSNQWAHYQAKRIRDSQLELDVKLLQVLAPAQELTAQTIAEYGKQAKRYEKDMAEIKQEAEQKTVEGALAHRKTDYFELAEGLLEISLILSSLYFLSHKKFLPMLGLLLGLSGITAGVLGLLLHL